MKKCYSNHLNHEIFYTPVELGPIVVPLSAQTQKVFRHSGHHIAADFDVDVSLRRLELAVSLNQERRNAGKKTNKNLQSTKGKVTGLTPDTAVRSEGTRTP